MGYYRSPGPAKTPAPQPGAPGGPQPVGSQPGSSQTGTPQGGATPTGAPQSGDRQTGAAQVPAPQQGYSSQAAQPPATPQPTPASQARAAQAYTQTTAAPRAAVNPTAAPRKATAGRRGCGGLLGTGILFMVLTLLVFAGLLAGYVGIAAALPNPDELQARASTFASTLIYDRQGNVLNEIADPSHGRRTIVKLDDISQYLKDATIATEDPNFYQHQGVDPAGMARAVYYAIRNRDISGPGGSTITQQLVKITFLSPERTPSRKIKEAVLATEISRRYSKEEVLQIYLNELNYGNLAYGIEAAAETYFGKHAKDLDLAEASMLAGLPQAPAYYDPYTKLWNADGTPGAVKQRQGIVLSLMVKHGSLTAEQADAAWREPLNLRPLKQSYTMNHPHFVLYVRDQVEKALGPELMARGGLKIYTTLDPKVQSIAEEEVAAQIKKLVAQGQNANDGALVAVRPSTGEILAMVGSADFYNESISGQINMAVSPRQPGSSIKPLTYLAAFEMPAAKIDDKTQPSDEISALEPAGGWTPSTALLDITTQFPDGANPPYVPNNYDNKEHGLVTVRSALENSYNIPAVKALQHVGLDRLKNMAARLGITTLTRPDYGLSLTLGGGEVTLLEMTGAYATLANNGVRTTETPIACVIDGNGQIIWGGAAANAVSACQAAAKQSGAPVITPAPTQAVVNPQFVYLMTSVLSDEAARRPAFGSAAALLSLPNRPSAAKTGTSNDYRDAWTLGYTPDLAVGVWVGNANNKEMKQTAGSVGAAPIWHNVMLRSLEGSAPQPFTEPQGMLHINVCTDTGTLPSEACPAQRQEVFAPDHAPLPARFDLHQRVRIDKATGKLATETTPADRVEVRDMLLFPPRYRAWAEAHGFPQLTAEQTAYAFAPELQLSEPANNSQVGASAPVAGRIHLPDPLVWRLEYGVGANPQGWGVLGGPFKGDVNGKLADWDVQATVAKHNVNDFSLRLAAYDPQHLDAPVAVSNVVYVTAQGITPTDTPTMAPVEPTATLPAATPTATSPAPTATAAPTLTPLPAAPTETPTAPPAATATPTTAAATPTPTAQAAAPLEADISAPAAGAQVSGRVAVMGIADGAGFQSYQLEYAPGDQPAPGAWQPVAPPQTQPSSATGGLLGMWPTQTLTPGRYTLRLTVMDSAGQLRQVQLPVDVAAP
jgi:membrane peptidoglycan carboxypeptidase